MSVEKSDIVEDAGELGRRWPSWARRLATVALLFHAAAIWCGAWAANPSSDLERASNAIFEPYDQVIRQGFSYRYYAPEPPPTPVITALLAFADGRPDKIVRIPDRSVWPRMLYQRQLNLANWLLVDVEDARRAEAAHRDEEARRPDGHDHNHPAIESFWARGFATYLGRANPGCKEVTLRVQMHLTPDIERVRAMLNRGGVVPVDLDADEFYTPPEPIGVFPCDAS